jgi:WD40 repeat protein
MSHSFCNNINSNGKFIYTSSDDNIIRIWECKNYTLHNTINGNKASYSLDSNYFYIVHENIVKIWKSDTNKIFKTLVHTEKVICADFSPDGKFIITISNKIKIWEIETGEFNLINENYIDNPTLVRYSPDGNYILVKCYYLIVIFKNTGELYQLLKLNEIACCVNYSPDSKYFVFAFIFDKTIQICEIDTGLIRTINWDIGNTMKKNDFERYYFQLDDFREIINLFFSTDSKYIISIHKNGTIGIFDNITCDLVDTFQINIKYESIIGANCIFDGKFVALILSNNTINIWDIMNKELIQTIYPLQYTNILNADLRKIKSDDLTEHDIFVLRQNGAITDVVSL